MVLVRHADALFPPSTQTARRVAGRRGWRALGVPRRDPGRPRRRRAALRADRQDRRGPRAPARHAVAVPHGVRPRAARVRPQLPVHGPRDRRAAALRVAGRAPARAAEEPRRSRTCSSRRLRFRRSSSASASCSRGSASRTSRCCGSCTGTGSCWSCSRTSGASCRSSCACSETGSGRSIPRPRRPRASRATDRSAAPLRILLPMQLPALGVGALLAYVLCLTELDATIVTYPPSYETVQVRIFNMVHYFRDEEVAALCLHRRRRSRSFRSRSSRSSGAGRGSRMKPGIRIQDLTVVRGGAALVRGVDFAVARGTVGAILGPSGAGKSTILRAIAGLVAPDRGTIELDGVIVFAAGPRFRPSAQRRDALPGIRAVVAPDGARATSSSRSRAGRSPRGRMGRARSARSSTRSGSVRLLGRRPASLSGGERQRLALARALVDAAGRAPPRRADGVRRSDQSRATSATTSRASRPLPGDDAARDPRSGRGAEPRADGARARPRRGAAVGSAGRDLLPPALGRGSRGSWARGCSCRDGPGRRRRARRRSGRDRRSARVGRGARQRAPPPRGRRGRGRTATGVEAVVVRESFHGPTFRLAVRVGDQRCSPTPRAGRSRHARAASVTSGAAPFFPEGSS